MKKVFAALIISLLAFWPIVTDAVERSGTGEQSPEQRQLLTKNQIQLAQERLKAEGFDPGPVNGVLNGQTEAAIREYQQKQGIPTSGALDEATLRELQLLTPPSGGAGGR
jgi:peptidoglycan hydrolase-like protein with peptidoglycan-binding domain